MYERILLPTDGSENAEQAVERAIDLATTYGADLHLLYVVDVKHMTSGTAERLMHEKLEQTGETAIDDITDHAEQAGIAVNSAVVPGTPAREILTYADDNDIDLIVMGTRGRTGFDRLLLGSVTEKVVRLSDVPVLTVSMTEVG